MFFLKIIFSVTEKQSEDRCEWCEDLDSLDNWTGRTKKGSEAPLLFKS